MDTEKCLLTQEEITEIEDQFIKEAKALHSEAGDNFIANKTSYEEYKKRVDEIWHGCYAAIAKAQNAKTYPAAYSQALRDAAAWIERDMVVPLVKGPNQFERAASFGRMLASLKKGELPK